jgi:HEAT repeat protein
MKSVIPFLVLFLGFAAALTAQEPPVANAKFETASAAAGLEAAVRQAGSRSQEPVWVGWSVPMVAKERFLCCLGQLGRKQWAQTTCHLEGKNQSWGSTDDVKVSADQDLLVLVRVRDREIDKVRSYSLTCSIDADGSRFVWLENVKPEESVALIAKIARGGVGPAKPGEDALSALSHHRNARADYALEEMAAAPHSRKLREDALFWLGQNRGERGARFLTRVMTGDPDEDIREKAIFSLSQSEVPGVADAIIRVSQDDRSAEVRGEALFWLAQMGDPKAPDVIFQAIDGDPDMEVRKKGVFALTQLPKGRGTPLLVRLGREGKHREIRKEALFWLAQSDDPAALEYLDKVLNE